MKTDSEVKRIKNFNLFWSDRAKYLKSFALKNNWGNRMKSVSIDQIRKVASDFIDHYEFETDHGKYALNDGDRAMIRDCVDGIIDELAESACKRS